MKNKYYLIFSTNKFYLIILYKYIKYIKHLTNYI